MEVKDQIKPGMVVKLSRDSLSWNKNGHMDRYLEGKYKISKVYDDGLKFTIEQPKEDVYCKVQSLNARYDYKWIFYKQSIKKIISKNKLWKF